MAKRFRFRLATVLKLRTRKRDECRRALAVRLRQIGAVQSRIDSMTEQLDHQFVSQRRLAMPEAPVADGAERIDRRLDLTGIRRHRDYANHLRRRIASDERGLSELRAQLALEREALEEASKGLKVIEKLEERQRDRHNLALSRAERAEADEIGSQFARRHAMASAAAGRAG
ncbi:MAG: flagellar export protein FliJ [Planctomycetota bacterium]|jgi:flagellar biosynthesis chaperone FliJ